MTYPEDKSLDLVYIIINNTASLFLTKYIHTRFKVWILTATYVLLKIVMFVRNVKLLQLFIIIIANILLQLIIFPCSVFLRGF